MGKNKNRKLSCGLSLKDIGKMTEQQLYEYQLAMDLRAEGSAIYETEYGDNPMMAHRQAYNQTNYARTSMTFRFNTEKLYFDDLNEVLEDKHVESVLKIWGDIFSCPRVGDYGEIEFTKEIRKYKFISVKQEVLPSHVFTGEVVLDSITLR